MAPYKDNDHILFGGGIRAFYVQMLQCSIVLMMSTATRFTHSLTLSHHFGILGSRIKRENIMESPVYIRIISRQVKSVAPPHPPFTVRVRKIKPQIV